MFPVLLGSTFAMPTPCVPEVPPPEEDLPAGVSRYEFVGATANGHRVALLVHRPGPRPFANVIVYEAGARSPLAEFPVRGPSKEDARAEALGAARPSLVRWRIDTTDPPRPVAWCRDEDTVRLESSAWTWSEVESPCPDPDRYTLDWRLCDTAHPDRCAEPSRLDTCWDEPVRPVALYRAGEVLWVVAERVWSEDLRARMAAGVLFAP